MPDSNFGYMLKGFEDVVEPLNLKESGQAWFQEIYSSLKPEGGVGVVLGATPWLTSMVCETHAKVFVIDKQKEMIESLRKKDPRRRLLGRYSPSEVFYFNSDWLDNVLPDNIGVVVGDNSFSFLRYRDEWRILIDRLADKMARGGVIITRLMCAPRGEKIVEVSKIVDYYIKSIPPLNYTEVRCRLLYACWDKYNKSIFLNDVYSMFEFCKPDLFKLMDRFEKINIPNKEMYRNDLMNTSKYEDCGVSYYAPELDLILEMFESKFKVREIHFGEYGMGECFPVICVTRR